MAYFTTHQGYFFLCSDIPSEEKQKLNDFLFILEESGVGRIIEEAVGRRSETGGRPAYDPYRLFATLLYAFSRHSGSLRRIEESIRFDIRFMYLMGQRVPSYSTISRFCNNVVVAGQRKIFSCIMSAIVRKYGIDVSDAFVDGTKLEANSNKYKFVWKPRKKHDRLNEGLRAIISGHFDLPDGKNVFTSKEIAGFLSKLREKIEGMGLAIVSGTGHRQAQIVRDFHSLERMLYKALEYEEIEAICGPTRNSYYKTDRDATAMCLKEDYYSGLGSNMHAAYSLQILVTKGFILDYLVSQDRADVKSFIPLLETYHADYAAYPKRICADSGYGSLENYRYMARAGMENFVKPPTWQRMISGQYIDLFTFDAEENLVCLNGKRAVLLEGVNAHSRGKGTRFYRVENCRRCTFKPYCMRTLKDKSSQTRTFEASHELYAFRKEAVRNLLSPKGVEMRINRSSQVEGAFGVIKQDMDYERVRRRGLENVSAECMLVCLGYNIRKMFAIIEGRGKTDYWTAPDGLEPEIPKETNLKRLMRKPAKGLNETLRKGYKYKKGVAAKH